MSSNESNIDYTRKELPGSFTKVGFTLFGIGLVLVIAAFLIDPARAALNNVVMLMFLISIGLGALFIVALEYVAGAVWSTPFRRIMEFFGAILLIVPIIAIPIFFNMHDVFHWTHPEVVKGDLMLESKSPYLNETFFVIRVLAFAAIWILFYLVITRNSRKQDDTRDQQLTKRNIRWSAIFIPIFGLTITFSSIDWLMSLEPHWFSTIFGVYYFSGTILAALAAGTFVIIKLNEKGYFQNWLVKDHYYSLGALMFAFINFWAYIAFSQYLLIWYANLPEETFWFLHRWEGGWMYVSIGLIFIQFVIPYFGLLSQPSKMDPKRLKIMSLWILFAHFYDIYWLVMPTYSTESVPFGWIELAFPLLAAGLIILVFTMRGKNQNIIPIGDPKLKRGLDFRL